LKLGRKKEVLISSPTSESSVASRVFIPLGDVETAYALCRFGVKCCASRSVAEESWVRDRGLSEACLFIPKGSVHLLLLITIVLAATRRDLVVSTERGPYLVRAVHSL
jgi:hypothetical protein